jgi:hypothetical protein
VPCKRNVLTHLFTVNGALSGAYTPYNFVVLITIGLTQAPLFKGGWGDLECLEHYNIFGYCCVSPKQEWCVTLRDNTPYNFIVLITKMVRYAPR